VLRQTEVARQAARGATERAAMRLRIGYLTDALPVAVPRALRRLTASLPAVQVDLESAPAWRLVDDVRRRRLDVAITSLPAPTNGLRSLALGEQGAVVALPAMHLHAVEPEIAIARLAPEQIVLLPYETNPAFRNAVVALCHAVGLAPTFIEVAEPRVEHALLAVVAGAGPAILPESASERYAMPGVRFVPLADARTSLQTVALTQPDHRSLATAAFLRALEPTTPPRAAEPSGDVVALSA
jgi:DNA-binding transcriptional LysR family regulator